jgi:hypothetical protein
MVASSMPARSIEFKETPDPSGFRGLSASVDDGRMMEEGDASGAPLRVGDATSFGADPVHVDG